MSPAKKKRAAVRAKAEPARRTKPTRRTKVSKPAPRTKTKAARRSKAKPARKPATRSAPKSSQRPASRSRLKLVVKRARAKPRRSAAPSAFAAAKAGASGRDLVLFELVRARVAVHAALQGLTGASANAPTANKWTVRETVLHLAYWDREMLVALEDCYRHDRKPALTHDDVLELNPIGVAELSHHDWEAAKRLMQLHRERLLEALQSIPEEPGDVWEKTHALGWLVRMLTAHDRHHADKIKAARTARESGAE